MKNFLKHLSAVLLLITFFIIKPIYTFATTTPSLWAAATYGILSTTYTNTVPWTTINWDVWFTIAPAIVPWGIHGNYWSAVPYATAGSDQATALSALNLQWCTFSFAPWAIDLATDVTHGPIGVYTPWVYCIWGAASIGTAWITLRWNWTYIFRINGALTTVVNSHITLDGASACDVFWTPAAATTLGANSTFIWTNIDDSGISIGNNVTWSWRALAFAETVTTSVDDTITAPICSPGTATLHIIKQVINNNSGSSTVASFNLHVKNAGTDVAWSPNSWASAPGTSYSLAPWTYSVSEDANSSYTKSFSWDCDSSGNITLSASDDKTCTVINDDITPPEPATINVVKTVINDNDWNATISDFPLFVNGTWVISGDTNIFPAPASYNITETSNSIYTKAFSGDCDSNGHLNLNPGDNKFCIITNNDMASTVQSSWWGGSSWIPPVPPLIDVVKIPSPLALPNGSGRVTYTYILRNIWTVPVSSVSMIGDTCKPINLIWGDINNNSKLDLNEVWTYRCPTILTKTHTNTVVATWWNNGLSTTDIASATVVVGMSVTPPLIHITKLPSQFILPSTGWIITYTNEVTNPWIVPLSNIHVTDDKCSPINYISGDKNADSKLDTNEKWIYTCKTNLTKTTLNTVTVKGSANNLTVRDIAIATVVVVNKVAKLPKLPNTWIPPENWNNSWNIVIIFSIFLLALSWLVFLWIWKRNI